MIVRNVKFNNAAGKDFFRELRTEVDTYFTEKKMATTANAAMIFKTVALFSIYFGAYALILTQLFSIWGMLALCVIMGIGKAGIGFSVAHDAIHGSYSKKKWVNNLLGFSMNLIGGSAYVWGISHNIVHHTYTNIHGMDEDLEVTSLIRLSPEQPYMKAHRFQHLYFPVFYSLATIFWVFLKDYRKLSQKHIGPFSRKHARKDVLITIGGKILYYAYTIALPLLILDVSILQFIIGFVTMHLVAGFILGIIFQLAHVVEETEHFAPKYEGTMDNAWAVHQMRTTANFAPTNQLLTWYVGGLNFQVEHHIFPNICSIHYPAISKIVRRVSEKHNVPYHCHKTFRAAVSSHINVLKRLGRDEVAGHVQSNIAA